MQLYASAFLKETLRIFQLDLKVPITTLKILPWRSIADFGLTTVGTTIGTICNLCFMYLNNFRACITSVAEEIKNPERYY